jgi:hypothetical protein
VSKKPKKRKHAFPPATMPAPTKLPGGVARIIQIAEDLRERNADGYIQKYGGILANIKQHGSLKIPPVMSATTCSPFTSTLIGVAFDPVYPRDDLNGDPYVPMFDGGTRPLMPFADFYGMANTSRGLKGDSPVNAIVSCNLGYEIDIRDMRRGDLVEINWMNRKGHAVICWDVHLDANGKVDCFQLLGSHSKGAVSIHGCNDKRWLLGENCAAGKIEYVVDGVTKERTGIAKRGTMKKAKPKIFVDEDDIVSTGHWFGLPGVAKGDIDLETFRVKPKSKSNPIYSNKKNGWSVGSLRCGRFHYDGDPPAPYCMKSGGAPVAPSKPGHVDAPAVVVKGEEVKRDPAAPRRVKPKKVKQEKDKPLTVQLYVEMALHTFFEKKWIAKDPGEPDAVNDAKTQDALKELQEKMGIGVDGIIGPDTLGMTALQHPACILQYSAQLMLLSLHRGKKLEHDPGLPDGVNNAQTKAAVEEFQKAHGLRVNGVPDSATQAKLVAVMNEHAPTQDKPGLVPELDHLYWVGNTAGVGGTARLRLHARDLMQGQQCAVTLHDVVSGKKVEATVKLAIDGADAEVAVPLPAAFVVGAKVKAHVSADVGAATKLEIETTAPLLVVAAVESEPADWRPYIDGGEVPADVLDAIRRNRARYPTKEIPLTKGRKAGPLHYTYTPGTAHQSWAKKYVKDQKIAPAIGADKTIAKVFFKMLDAEGYPASVQTWDKHIVTWGTGLAAKGNLPKVFPRLQADAEIARILEGVGIDNRRDAKGLRYHVVDLDAKTVVSSTLKLDEKATRKSKRKKPVMRLDHDDALEAVRRQPDLMLALIGVSEAAATRERVLEAQWAVYLSSAEWAGQNKVFTLALNFTITHMFHWLPAVAKRSIDVPKELAAMGATSATLETDKELAVRVFRSFYRELGVFYAKEEGQRERFRNVLKTHVWRDLRKHGEDEGFDPGAPTYEEEA